MVNLRLTSSSRVLVALILVVAIALSVFVYSYFSYSAANIQNSAIQESNVNTQIEAMNLATSLSNKLDDIANNLFVLTNSACVENDNSTSAQILLQAVQNTTAGFTSSYAFYGPAGQVMDASNPDGIWQPLANISQRPFFTEAAKVWPSTYVDPEYVSEENNTNYVLFARAAYAVATSPNGTMRTFQGVVVAAVNFLGIGDQIRSELATPLQAQLSVVDTNGTILFAGLNSSNVGKNAFSPEVQAQVPEAMKGSFEAFLQASLAGHSSLHDFSLSGTSIVIASHPVLVGDQLGNSSDGRILAVMYVASPSTLAASQLTQVRQLQAFSASVVLGIAFCAAFHSVYVLQRNKTLIRLVRERTGMLEESKHQLEDANQRLVSSSEAQKEFINVAAHEIRTPLQPILTITELMADSLNHGDGRALAQVPKSEVDMLERGVRRLDAITRNLLDVTKIEGGGGLNLRTQHVDLNELLAEELGDLGSRSTDLPARPEITFTPSGSAPFVDLDKTRMFEVISNLVSNALKASDLGASPKIDVSCSTQGGEAIVRVRDYGRGLKAEMLPRLFTKFSSDSLSGFGLGLYISKKIVDAHGGQIWAENNDDGKGGASFFLSLPIAG